MKVSIISPVYQAQHILRELVNRIQDSIVEITDDYEVILVEDGSADSSWEVLRDICQKNERVIGVKLSKNFGQHYAISAGLQICKGDVAIILDCDLQDNPVYFSDFIESYNQGNQIVYTVKNKRKHSWWKNMTAKAFTTIFNKLTNNEKSSLDVGSFTMISRKVIDAFNQIEDKRRHFLMIVRTLGFKSTYIEIKHEERFEGESSYTFSKLMKHAMDGITSQSDKLLRMSIYLGFAFASLSIGGGLWIIYRKFSVGFQAGWATLVVLVMFSSGMILVSLGIMGVYIGRVFEQAKNPPLFIIDQVINSEEWK